MNKRDGGGGGGGGYKAGVEHADVDPLARQLALKTQRLTKSFDCPFGSHVAARVVMNEMGYVWDGGDVLAAAKAFRYR